MFCEEKPEQTFFELLEVFVFVRVISTDETCCKRVGFATFRFQPDIPFPAGV